MGWFQRLFGQQEQTPTVTAPQGGGGGGAATAEAPSPAAIPPERMGVSGEYDQSGLAKRVALALDQDPEVAAIDTVWVAQTGSKVVLKGRITEVRLRDKIITIARGVAGATDVDASQVEVG